MWPLFQLLFYRKKPNITVIKDCLPIQVHVGYGSYLFLQINSCGGAAYICSTISAKFLTLSTILRVAFQLILGGRRQT